MSGGNLLGNIAFFCAIKSSNTGSKNFVQTFSSAFESHVWVADFFAATTGFVLLLEFGIVGATNKSKY